MKNAKLLYANGKSLLNDLLDKNIGFSNKIIK